jgi:23S rRNA pseudouridine2605 synthase
MNEESIPEPVPATTLEEPPATARRRVRKAKVQAAEVEAAPAEPPIAVDAPSRGFGPPAESSAGESLPSAAAEPLPSGDAVQMDGPADGLDPRGPEGAGERAKRSRRRGRRGKEGRDGKAAATNLGPSQPQRGHEDPSPSSGRVELEPHALERLGETFAHVMSEGYDEDATPTDEELRALEERAQAQPVEASADAVADPDQSGEPDATSRFAPVAGVEPAAIEDDGDVAAKPADAPAAGDDRRVLAPQRDAPKLQKVLAQSGAGSRRDIEQWISGGRVTVNGKAAHTGQRVSFGDRVAVDGKQVRIRIAPLPARVIAYHKPVGEIVTHDDPQQRPTVFRKLPRLVQGKWQSVGRLDINTEGLLLFTNSGELANQLMHPRFGIEREYAVRVLGALDDEARGRLLEGVDVDGQRAAFLAIDDGAGEGANRWYRVTIAEGRHREVRRLFDAVGLAVSRLIRIRYGAVVLPRGLKRGVWVDLPDGDVKALRRLVGIGDRRERAERGDRGERGGRQDDARAGKGRRGRGRRPQPQGQPRQPHEGARAPAFNQGAALDRRDPQGKPRRGRDRDRGQPQARGPRGEGQIPNPLLQTYDRRAAQEAKRTVREYGDDDPIPNPLQQNYDKRALREANRTPRREYRDDGPIPNPLQQTFDKRQIQGHGDALVLGKRQQPRRGQRSGQPHQPDPMQTAVGYIGADAFHTKVNQGRGNHRQGRRRR